MNQARLTKIQEDVLVKAGTIDADTSAMAIDLAAIEVDTSAIDTRQAAQADTLTGFHTTIDGDHRYIHEGKKFSAPLEITMAQDDIYLISFTSPTVASGKYAHWRPVVISSISSNLLVRIYEDIASTGGDAVTPLNMDRNSATASVSTVKKGVTATVAAANLIAVFSVGSGGGPQSRGGGTGGGATEEIILEVETEYIIEVEEPNVAATTAVVELRWYEED